MKTKAPSRFALEMPKPVEISFEDAVNNIMFIKRQQWVITNYAIAVQGGIYIVGNIPPFGSDIGKIFVTILSVAACLLNLWGLRILQRGIMKFRGRLTWIYRTYFTPAERCGLGLSIDRRKFWHDPLFFLSLCIVSMIAAVVVLLITWRIPITLYFLPFRYLFP